MDVPKEANKKKADTCIILDLCFKKPVEFFIDLFFLQNCTEWCSDSSLQKNQNNKRITRCFDTIKALINSILHWINYLLFIYEQNINRKNKFLTDI